MQGLDFRRTCKFSLRFIPSEDSPNPKVGCFSVDSDRFPLPFRFFFPLPASEPAAEPPPAAQSTAVLPLLDLRELDAEPAGELRRELPLEWPPPPPLPPCAREEGEGGTCSTLIVGWAL